MRLLALLPLLLPLLLRLLRSRVCEPTRPPLFSFDWFVFFTTQETFFYLRDLTLLPSTKRVITFPTSTKVPPHLPLFLVDLVGSQREQPVLRHPRRNRTARSYIRVARMSAHYSDDQMGAQPCFANPTLLYSLLLLLLLLLIAG